MKNIDCDDKNSKPQENQGFTDFGYKQVERDKKRFFVEKVFNNVANKYDLMNDLMSGGMHRLWKNAMINWLNPSKLQTNFRHLDVAGGTGDIALRVANITHEHALSYILDINENMLLGAKTRLSQDEYFSKLRFLRANAEDIPFEDEQFDCYTIAFGIRNVTDKEKALREAYRVLKLGGRFICLEFSHIDVPIYEKIYDAYSFNVIPKMGKLVTNDESSYQYLVESIRQFPKQDEFSTMIAKGGFEKVTYRNFTLGVAAIHSGWKI